MAERIVDGQKRISVDSCRLCGQPAYRYEFTARVGERGQIFWDVTGHEVLNPGTCPKTADPEHRHTITGM